MVKIVGILSILIGMLIVIGGVLSVGIFTTLMYETDVVRNFPIESMQILFYIIIGSGIATALQGYGLLKMKPWTWMMVVFFLLAMVFFSIHGYISNGSALVVQIFP